MSDKGQPPSGDGPALRQPAGGYGVAQGRAAWQGSETARAHRTLRTCPRPAAGHRCARPRSADERWPVAPLLLRLPPHRPELRPGARPGSGLAVRRLGARPRSEDRAQLPPALGRPVPAQRPRRGGACHSDREPWRRAHPSRTPHRGTAPNAVRVDSKRCSVLPSVSWSRMARLPRTISMSPTWPSPVYQNVPSSWNPSLYPYCSPDSPVKSRSDGKLLGRADAALALAPVLGVEVASTILLPDREPRQCQA